jgi:glucose/arabinose dehydrogenase
MTRTTHHRRSRIELIVVAGLLCASSTASAQSADEIVAANIAATGGEEAISRIENFTSTGQVVIESPLFGRLEGTLEAVRAPGKGYFETVDLGIISQQKGWDGAKAWEQGPNGLRMLEGEEAAALPRQSHVSPLAALQQLAPAGMRIERLDDTEVNGRAHFTLAVSGGNSPPSTLYLDRETVLLSRSTAVTNIPGLGEAKSVTEVGDYESVGGVMLAMTITIDVEGISTTNIAFDRTVVNTAVDESIFAVPTPTVADGDAQAEAAAANAQADPYGGPYQAHCSVCHGVALEGAALGTPLVGVALKHGDSVDALGRSIAAGFAATGMPAWSETLNENAIHRLAIFIAEQRASLSYADFKVAAPPSVPTGSVVSELHAFRVETVAEGIDPLPYSIAPLPDGRILVTEKTQGLRLVSPDGELSDPIRGTPLTFDDGFELPGLLLVYGQGYLLDVATHPDFARNGWIYLSYTDRCSDCNAESRAGGRPVSMVALIRGRIERGAWIDEETIWKTDIERYTAMPDMAAGGRIAFDDDGHVFLTVGIKGGSEIAGVQDLSQPYGKIHRLNDDGSIPGDNPFVGQANALESIWTYGHRSPQGLEFDPQTGRLWGTEMGQRGGDEVNLLQRGRNYGWPLVSKGMQYDGRPVDFAAELGIEFKLQDIEQPVVDLTPAPAVSSFIVYDGAAFPEWRGNLLVGTLKATELYRMVVDGNRVAHTETVLAGIGRIRDVGSNADGLVYLLLEHASGGRIVRLVPAP